MKLILILLGSFIFSTSHSQSNWQNIEYITDSSGKEVAKKVDGNWIISNPNLTIETLQKQLSKNKRRCDIQYQMLLLVVEGKVVDKDRWQKLMTEFRKL